VSKKTASKDIEKIMKDLDLYKDKDHYVMNQYDLKEVLIITYQKALKNAEKILNQTMINS